MTAPTKGADISAVAGSMQQSQEFQMKLMELQNKHQMIMSAYEAMKNAFAKIRA